MFLTLVTGIFFFPPALVEGENALDPEGWPRSYQVEGAEIAIYMPQVLEWSEFRQLKATAAVGLKLEGSEEATFGAVGIEAETVTDFERGNVALGRREFTGLRFPELDAATAEKAEALLRSVLTPDAPLEIPLTAITAAMERADAVTGDTAVSFDPPPIFYSASPALLVVFIGEPKLEAVNAADPSLMFAVNTNWDVLFDGTSYYLLAGEQWLVTEDVMKGPWTAASSLPASFQNLPDDGNWSEVKSKLFVLPDPATPPKLWVSDRPAEMIMTEGKPQLGPISGTSVMYVVNTQSDLFYQPAGKMFYLLTSGRWFGAPSLDGPWSAATETLPEDFSKIPPQHPKAEVLVSVRGTPEADEAVILASIPQTATVDRATAAIEVSYEGTPQFKPVPGAGKVAFAINTAEDVFLVGKRYYCCHEGVWFEAGDALGAWEVCDKVPAAIYTIPPQSPKYNVTHVHVYASTPQTVQVGVTSSYSGSYVARGLVVFGLGMWLGHEMAENHAWYGRFYPKPSWYGYGCGAHYQPGFGYCRRGAVAYGPYGGAGYGARYNAATGTYSRGAYAYGPYRAAGARVAYNPWSNTAAGRVGVATPYGSWGRSAVVRDDDWVRAGHRSNARGTVGGVQTSAGGAAVGVNRRYGSDAFVGKTGSGDVYVGKDGKIYRKEADGGWQTRENGKWSQAPQVPRASSPARPPSGRPTPPATRPKLPEGRPTQPAGRPTQPATRPTPPTARPKPPEGRPTQPVGRPTQPATRPTPPTARPKPPEGRPTQPVGRPTQPAGRPTQPATPPTPPAGRPTQPAGRPTQPANRPATTGNAGRGYTNRQSTPAQLNRDSYSRQRSGGGGAQPGFRRR